MNLDVSKPRSVLLYERLEYSALRSPSPSENSIRRYFIIFARISSGSPILDRSTCVVLSDWKLATDIVKFDVVVTDDALEAIPVLLRVTIPGTVSE
jgi:hypothetical protein